MKNIDDFKVGQKVNYSFFSNVIFEGLDNLGQVILKDKNGNVKKVSERLFLKYALIVNE